MKYINKKTNLFVLIVSSLLLCIFIGCSNLTDSEEKSNAASNNDKQITVTGKIFPETGRSANTSFTLTEAHSINVWATQEKSGAEPLSAVAQITGNTYTLKLTKYGDWKIHLYITCENKDGQESVLVNLSKDISISEDDSSITLTEPFVINSGYSTVHNGSIWLGFKDETNRIDNMTYTAMLRIPDTGNTNSLINGGIVYFTPDFHDAGLQLDNVAPNSYEVTFCFNDIKGNTLYSCKEIITVLAGFTTDTWIGEGAHLRNNSRTGKTEFVITNELLEKYDADIQTESNYLLYSRKSNNDGMFDYYVVDSLDSSIPESVNFSNISSFDSYKGYAKNYSCFDADGYYYVITKQEESATYITSNKPGFGNNGEYIAAFNIGKYFSVDKKTGLYYSADSSYSTITQLTDSEGQWLSGSRVVNYTLLSENNNSLSFDDVFAINDGIAYFTMIPSSSNLDASFYVVDLSKTEEDENGVSVVVERKIIPNDFFIQLTDSDYMKPRVTDMLYQDGYVYLLLRYDNIKAPYNLNFYSTGAVIRYNTFTKQFDETVLGLADAIEHDDEAYVEVKGDAGQKFYNNNSPVLDENQELVVKAKDIGILNFYSPETTLSGSNLQLSTKAFYGPQKFIAVKPKKLIISDDGIAFYTDAEGLYKYKNVNRVVIVDLEKFSAQDNEFECVATSLEFDFKENDGSGYLASNQTSGSYWNFSLPYPIPVYTRDTKELYQNCIYCGEQNYMQNDSLKFFGETGDGGCGGRPLIRRED